MLRLVMGLALALLSALTACGESENNGSDDDPPRTPNVVVKTITNDGTCLPRPLIVEGTGEVPCTVVEARLPGTGGCSCDASTGRVGRTSAAITSAVRQELMASTRCSGDTGVSCSDYCLCDVRAFTGAELDACQNSVTAPSNLYGYCYVHPDAGIGNPELVATCPDTQRQIIRFLGSELPAPDALAYIACTGASQTAAPPSP